MAALDVDGEPAPSATPLIGPVAPPEVHVMSFNIRRRMPHLRAGHPDAWQNRRVLLRRLLATERPSILGVQEALAEQSAFVADALGPRYASVGSGRNRDGSGERCTLYFDRERFTVLDWQQLALSDTPDQPGSRSWGNLIPRIAVRADLIDSATGERIRVINTHFDHLSAASRVRSARLIAEVAASGASPAIVMGDFNARVASPPYRALVDDGGLEDSWSVATERLSPEWSTYSNYRPPRTGGKRIDWLLVSPGTRVLSAAINGTRFDGAAASDHEPVQAVVRFGTRRSSSSDT